MIDYTDLAEVLNEHRVAWVLLDETKVQYYVICSCTQRVDYPSHIIEILKGRNNDAV